MLAAARKHGLSSRDHSWSSELPPEWDVAKLRRLLTALDQGWSPTAEDRQVGEREWGVLKLSAISHGSFLPSEHKALPPDEAPDPSIEVRPGDVLLTRANTPKLVGDACFVGRTRPGLMFSDLIYRLRFNDSVDPRFVTYWLVSAPGRHQIEVDARGSSQSMVKVSQSHIRAWRVPVPGVVLQRQIADFLDRETAKIDRLTEEKQRLIELLEEKRAALITQAVTKGLDPAVEMKDSGVKWLGEIPAHWDAAPLFARYEVELGKMLDSKTITGAHLVRYVRNVDVQWHSVNTADLPSMDFSPSDRIRYRLKPGDLLVCEGGEVGRTAIWKGELGECYYQKAIHRLRPHSSRDVPKFFLFVMEAAARLGVFTAGSNPNTIDHLTAVQLKHHRFPFPPKQEQVAIARFLSENVEELNNVQGAITEAVSLLREYRTALISAAVTGKIDVREEAA